MRHLLVTNDFPPKLGGIQSYLWELWRRLDPERFVVLTTSHPEAAAFDDAQPFQVERLDRTQFLPTPAMARLVRDRARAAGVGLVVLDPAVPIGLVGPRLGIPYGVVLHGAEVTVPGRLPVSRQLLAHVVRHSTCVIAAGTYPAAQAARLLPAALLPPVSVVPPGVDSGRFRPLDPGEVTAARARFGLPLDGPLVVCVSRLVPRKGQDVLVRAAARLAPGHPGLCLAVSGQGRDRDRLARLIGSTGAPVRLLGAVPDADLPALYGCGDVFAMPCRNRWFGLEQEGFGIVFLEAAACGRPQVAGESGGAAEAVVDGETGLVVAHPGDTEEVTAALDGLLSDAGLRSRMGAASRQRAETTFSYDTLADRLDEALAAAGG
jgi:phosphatidylinositol alpha-1,6-mannosyltransferase